MQSNAVVVQGRAGVLLVDPGVLGAELDCIAEDLREWGQSVVAGFATHPHWDHLLWHAAFGDVPRYGTARCAAVVRERLSDAGAKARVATMIPADIVEQVPLDLLGNITALPADAARIPWDGPEVRIVEHRAHACGHAALVVGDVLVAGDMLSDILIPMLDANSPTDPVDDYLTALGLLESTAAATVIPGHGSVSDQVQARIDLDRAYATALRDPAPVVDPRISPSAAFGQGWLPALHDRQLQSLAART
ncbi:Glyoxylase, beta-lactamase superfamily II [Actinokineospora terrae]|uniref:Glyoxylase, beta-lactamase superfamily II n=2 Tax=Actinokineospora terrae TaxID=155974 RepID=A0A1H9XMH5_9PSEU|nr:Glyoxylase, beta-lactamase superfamily II [Actinokineospora terrae]